MLLLMPISLGFALVFHPNLLRLFRTLRYFELFFVSPESLNCMSKSVTCTLRDWHDVYKHPKIWIYPSSFPELLGFLFYLRRKRVAQVARKKSSFFHWLIKKRMRNTNLKWSECMDVRNFRTSGHGWDQKLRSPTTWPKETEEWN